MGGFGIFLCVIAGIIALFIAILSVPVHVTFTYTDKIYLTVRYLFIKLNILPLGEKKKKPAKEKKSEEKAEEEGEEKEESPEEKKEESGEKKPNPIIEMVKANGYDGMMLVLSNFGKVMAKYGSNLLKSFVFDEIELYITVGTGDAASTAIKYGKTCQKVYPLLGFICDNNIVHKYDVNVEPDFLANHSTGEMHTDFHMVVRKIINSSIGMAIRLVFKVALQFLKGAKKNKSANAEQKEIVKEVAEIQSDN